MSVPKYNEMYGVLLKALADGKVHKINDVRQNVVKQIGLTDRVCESSRMDEIVSETCGFN